MVNETGNGDGHFSSNRRQIASSLACSTESPFVRRVLTLQGDEQGGIAASLTVCNMAATMQVPSSKRFPWAIYWIALVVLLMVMFAPVGSVTIAGTAANAFGCTVDEGSVHPCLIGGKDFGELLYTLGVLGWLMLLTLPIGALAVLIWIIVLLLHRRAWRNRSTREIS